MISMTDCRLSDPEIEAATRVMRAGGLRQGAVVAAFENAFAKKTGARRAIACSSGTAALHLACLARFRPGDEVLVPALTFLSTASMALAVGAVPVFVDVDPETWLMDLDDAARRLTPRTRGVIPVHLFGNPCDPVAIGAFADRHGLSVVWDAAQAHGATVAGCDVGAFGPLVCYSLYATKNLFVGEGGLVCVEDEALAERLRRLRQHGVGEDGLCREQGFNYRLTDIAAAIGLAQLDRFDDMLATRRRNASRLVAGLAGIPGLSTQRTTAGGNSARHQLCVRVDPARFGATRDALAARLAADGVETAVYYRHALPDHPAMATPANPDDVPVARGLCGELLALPTHHGLGEGDIDMVIERVAACNETVSRRP